MAEKLTTSLHIVAELEKFSKGKIHNHYAYNVLPMESTLAKFVTM